MTWTHLQSNSATSAEGGLSGTVAATFTSNLTAGSKILVAIAVNAATGGPDAVVGVSDGTNALTELTGVTTTGEGWLDLWYEDTPSGLVGTKPTITATLGAVADSYGATILIQEVSGLLTGSSGVDGTIGTNTGSSTGPATGGSYSSSAANEYLCAIYGDVGNGVTVTNATGSTTYTPDANNVNASGNATLFFDYGNSTNGPETASFALSGTAAWATILVAFQLGSPPVIITPATLPRVIGIGQAYTFNLSVTGGSGSGYTWTVSSGSLPSGLSLSGSGSTDTISGTVTGSPASSTFTIKVTDGASNTGTQSYTISTITVPAATVPALAAIPGFSALGGATPGDPGPAPSSPANGPAFYPAPHPVRAAILPKPRLSGVYMGLDPQAAPDTSFGTGQIQWNAGGPVANPAPGPVFHPKTSPARASIPPKAPLRGVYMGMDPQSNPDTSFGTGQVQWNSGAPVAGPATGPVFHQATSPCRARIPREATAGSVTGYGSGGAICGSVNGNGFGQGNGSKGAPVSNPNPGPVFFQRRTPVRFVLSPPPPRKGRVGSSFGAPVQNPIHGPPAYPLQGPIRVRLPQLQPRAGRVNSSAGAPVRNPVPGPVFYPAVQALRARLPLQPLLRGRSASNAGTPVKSAALGPVFRPAVQALRARLPQQPLLRGRMASVWGAPVQNPTTGPVFTQGTSPVRSHPQPPPRGRAAGNRGTQVKAPSSGPALHPQGLVRGRILQTFSKGRAASNPGAPVHNPTSGPVFRQATSPARTRVPQVFSKGRVSSNPGTPVTVTASGPVFRQRNLVKAQLPLPRRGTCRAIGFYPPVANPTAGPVFYPATSPIRARFPLPPRGRTSSNAGAPVVTSTTGPRFHPATSPIRARIPQNAPRGRIEFNAGAPVENPAAGPVFQQKTSPARIRPALPPRGRVAFNKGAPVSVSTTGPVFYPRNYAKAQLPLPRRGTCRAIRFYPVQVNPPGPPPPVYPLQQPVRAPLPPLHPRAGRIGSNPGGPVSNPSAGPAFTSMSQPAGMRVIFLATGRAQSTKSYGAPAAPASGPVFTPADSPARARVPRNAPRGRVYANTGAPVRNATTGPAFRQAVHPAIARFPLPPRGRVYSNPGAPVHNPTSGPVFRPATAPIRARIPQRPLGGHCTSTPPSTVPVDITGLFEIVFPCAHLDAPASFPLPPPAVSLTGTVFPGEIGPFTPVLPHLKTSLTGTVLHQPLNLVLPLPVTSLSGQFNDARFNITLPPPVTGLSGKRVHTGTFAIVFNICSGMGGRYGLVITPPKPLKADFPESVDYATGIPYVTWAASDPYTSWITG